VNTLDKLWKLLSDRFGGQKLTKKNRTELRNRRRKHGESLDSLCTDVRRLLIMGYPGPRFTAHEAIARDSFIGALDSELAQKVRERDPSTLDEAMHTAVRLETIREAVPAADVTDDTVRKKNKHARGINTGAKQSAISSVLAKMNEMQSRLDKHLKVIGDQMANVETAVRRPQQSDVRNLPGRACASAKPERGSMPSAPEVSSQNSHQSSTATEILSALTQRACYYCGDVGHI